MEEEVILPPVSDDDDDDAEGHEGDDDDDDDDADAVDDDVDDDVAAVEICNLLETKLAELRGSPVLFAGFLDVYRRVQPRLVPLLSEIMCLAVIRDNRALVTTLLNTCHKEIDVNHRSVSFLDGGTPLTTAARARRPGLVRTLLEHGARVGARTRSGESALEASCSVGDVTCVDVLLAHVLTVPEGAARDDLLYSGMVAAAYNGHGEVLRRFVAQGVDVNLNLDDELGTTLHRCIEGGSIECTDIILNAGADVEALRTNIEQTPLMCAAEFGHVNILARLLNRGADIDRMTDECSSALNMACHYGHTACVKYLIARGANPHVRNPWGFTPLFMGADTLEIVQVLVDTGVELDVKCGDRGEAAIHLASVVGSAETVRLLLDRGSYINVKTFHQETPLWLAAWKGHADVCRLLVQRNCTLDDASNGCQVYAYDYMPVEIAMGLGHMDIMRMLMLAGCSLCNSLYFKDDDPGILEEIPWVKLRPEPMHLKMSHVTDYQWFHNFVTNTRSLKHACRLRIRTILGSQTFEQKVSQLGLPTELVEYLMFSDLF